MPKAALFATFARNISVIVSFGQKTDLLLDVIFREPEDYDAANSSLLFSILFLWLFSVSMIHHLF